MLASCCIVKCCCCVAPSNSAPCFFVFSSLSVSITVVVLSSVAIYLCINTVLSHHLLNPSLTHDAMVNGEGGTIDCPEGSFCAGGECICYGGRTGPNCTICKYSAMYLHSAITKCGKTLQPFILHAANCSSNVICYNNGSCDYINGTSVCLCSPPFTGADCTQRLPSEWVPCQLGTYCLLCVCRLIIHQVRHTCMHACACSTV